MSEENGKTRGKPRMSFNDAVNSASDVLTREIIAEVNDFAKANKLDPVEVFARVIAAPTARVRLFETERIAAVEAEVEKEKTAKKAQAAVADLSKLGLSREDILAMLGESE